MLIHDRGYWKYPMRHHVTMESANWNYLNKSHGSVIDLDYPMIITIKYAFPNFVKYAEETSHVGLHGNVIRSCTRA